MAKNPITTIEMENGAKIVIELLPETAPNTVNNFITLAQQGFYDGLLFFRAMPDFAIQAGCPKNDGTCGPGYCIKGEFRFNQHENPVKHTRGVVTMARGDDYNSAGSQFFIVVRTCVQLNAYYASFGRVIEGMEEVDRILNLPQGVGYRPFEDQRIKKVTVETFGGDYSQVEKIPL